MFPWMPLSADSHIPVPSDWVVTIYEPVEKIKQDYTAKHKVEEDGNDQTPTT